MVPLRWSARPSDFLTLSPLRAPAASLRRPFALSIAPSVLSSRDVLPRLPIRSSSGRMLFVFYPSWRRANMAAAGSVGNRCESVLKEGERWRAGSSAGEEELGRVRDDPGGLDGRRNGGGGPDRRTDLSGPVHPAGVGCHALRAPARATLRGARAGDLRARRGCWRAGLRRVQGR